MEKYKRLLQIAEQEFLSDAEYLEQFASYIYRFRSNEICGIKDVNSIHVLSTKPGAFLLGWEKPQKMVGRSDFEVPWHTAQYANIFYKQDREVEQIRKIKSFLDIHEFPCGLRTLRFIKFPIINPTTNKVLGTIFKGESFNIHSIFKTIVDIHKRKYGTYSSMSIVNSIDNLNLTPLEFEVLFCICLGISNKKSIASFLTYVYGKDISHESTVNEAFRRLYRKLNCSNTAQLLEFAVFNNLHLQIPQSFIKIGSFEI